MSIMHDRRMDEVREHMKALGLSALIVSETAALWYLTGESIHPGERLTVLVLQAKGPAFWIRNRLFPLKSGTSWTMAEAKAAGYIADISFEDGEDGMKLLSDHLPEGKVGVDKVWPSSFLLDLMSRRKDLKFVNGSPAVDSARAVKDEREIGIMRLASNINDRAMKKISRWITPGVTEKECAEKLLAIYKEEGAEGFSFPPIAAISPRGSCITCQVYCHEFPSVKSFGPVPRPPTLSLNGLNGSRQFPFVSRPRAKPTDRSNTFVQLFARRSKYAASAFLPSASANRAAHQSS